MLSWDKRQQSLLLCVWLKGEEKKKNEYDHWLIVMSSLFVVLVFVELIGKVKKVGPNTKSKVEKLFLVFVFVKD